MTIPINPGSRILNAWNKVANYPGGKWLFSKLLCREAPYFSTISPRFVELRPGYCEVTFKKRRAVLNHIGTIHAIAMCNLAELAGGTMTDVTIPRDCRWIPKGMVVEYLAKAETDLRAVAELPQMPEFDGAMELPVIVKVVDTNDQLVFRATITMWISHKPL